MNKQNKNTFQSRLPKLELSYKPTLIITEKLKRQIDYLHNKVGRSEWSGELITREEGSITQLDEWKVYAEDIFLADIGSGVFTGYEVDKGGFKNVDIIQMYDTFPGLLNGTHKNHHCHTHHSMGAFFSSTDWEQLEDRGISHNYFIMLIVDFAGTYKAKCAFKGKRKITTSPTLEFFNNADGYAPFTLNIKEKDEEVLVVMDMEVVIPKVNNLVPINQDVRIVMEKLSGAETVEEGHLEILLEYLNDYVKNRSYLVDEPFSLRYEAVVKALEEEKNKTKTYTSGFNPGNNYSGYSKGTYQQGNLYSDDEYDYGGYDWEKEWEWTENGYQKKTKDEINVQGKKISEMTDKEYHEFEKESETIEWDSSDVKALLNAAIAGNYSEDRISDPVEQFKRKDKKLRSKLKREEWIQEFQADISQKVYDFWKKEPTVKDAQWLLSMCLEYLTQYRSIQLINEVCEAIETEIDYMVQEIMYYSNYEKRGGFA